MEKKKVLIVLGAMTLFMAAVVGGIFLKDRYFNSQDTNDATPLDRQNNFTNETSEEPSFDPDAKRPKDDDEPVKQTPVPSIVTERPLIYTGFGHSDSNPLKNGQVTSTTCTSEPAVTCEIIATNQSGDEVSFGTKQTDAEGVALWRWTGGVELTSGTWTLTAIVGDKQSNGEVIYVQ